MAITILDSFILLLFLSQRLKIGLVIAPNLVTKHDKGKVVKDIAMLGRQFQDLFRQFVVKLLLLDTVIQCGMPQVLVSIGNEKFFQLYKQQVGNE